MRFDLRLLPVFVAVAEELHFGRAADRVQMTQPAVSQQITRLEQQLRLQLFERTTRSVRLTPAGSAFLERARAALAEAEAAVAEAQAVTAHHKGLLRLAVDVDVPQQVHDELRAGQRAHPDIRILTDVRDYPIALEELARGNYDAVLGWVGDFAHDLTWEVVRRVPLDIVMSVAHPLARSTALTRAQVSEHPFALFARDSGPEAYDFIVGHIEGDERRLQVVVVPHVGSSLPSLFAHVRDEPDTMTVGLPGHEAHMGEDLIAVPLDPPMVVDLVLVWRRLQEPPAVSVLRSLPGWDGQLLDRAL